MSPRSRISTATLVTVVTAWFVTAACSESNPPSIKYTKEYSIYDAGNPNSGIVDTDAGLAVPNRGAYACTPGWTGSHKNCGITIAGDAIAKGVSCTGNDTQLCYKTCGPDNSGYKAEICSGGIYSEDSQCSFDPACDWGCFKLPMASDKACPATAPRHGDPCALPACVVCGGTIEVQTTGYLDSKNSKKEGYCVCLPATSLSSQKWGCAQLGSIWPCPGNLGC